MNVEDRTYCRFNVDTICDEWIKCSSKCRHHRKSKERIERLAAQQHAIWSHWMKYLMVDYCHIHYPSEYGHDAIHCIYKKTDFNRWLDQLKTSYVDLSEEDKEKDRAIVRQFILGEDH